MRNTLDIKKSRCLIGVAVAAIAAFAIITGGSLTTQIRAEEQAGGDALVVGTYNEQEVFQQYPDRDKLQDAQMEAQEEMREAQDDQEKSQQIQQEFYQKQQEIIDDFQNTVEEALSEVAEETGVKVIATQVKYTDDDVDSKDVTSEVVEAIGGDPEAKQTLPEELQQ